MTNWPLICNRCGSKRYIGILYGGMCPDCHSVVTHEMLDARQDTGGGQSALGDFA